MFFSILSVSTNMGDTNLNRVMFVSGVFDKRVKLVMLVQYNMGDYLIYNPVYWEAYSVWDKEHQENVMVLKAVKVGKSGIGLFKQDHWVEMYEYRAK